MPSNESVQTALALIEGDKSKILGLTVGSKQVVEPGQYIPKADAQDAPTLSFAVPDASRSYMVVSLDVDAPFPSFGVLGPILHWIQPGLRVQPANELKATAPFVANYIGPAPPPVSGPHRYCFFLYEQPADFDGKAHAPPDGAELGVWQRMRFSLDDWERQISPGPILAANYFTSN